MKTWANFHDATTADFAACQRPAGEPDFVSPSGSRYWRLADGVVRESDHWGVGIKSCNWFFEGAQRKGLAVGLCPWAAFAADPAAVPAYRAWAVEMEIAAAVWQAERDRIAALRRPGVKVRVIRRVLDRVAGGHFSERIEELIFEIARFTPQFVVAANGRRYALSTIRQWAAA